MQTQGAIGPSGHLSLKVIRGGQVALRESPYPQRPATVQDVLAYGTPQRGLDPEINRWRLSNQRHLFRGIRRVAFARALRLPHFYGQLWLKVIRGDGTVEELGLASMRVVTDAGVNSIVDAFMNTFELENY